MKKKLYEISINGGKKNNKKYTFGYRNTKNIEMYIKKDAAYVCFKQSSKRTFDDFLSDQDQLCINIFRQLKIIHLILYGEDLVIKSVGAGIDDEKREIYEKEEPLIFSMIEHPYERQFSDNWKNNMVIERIINTTKSCYDGRYNALMSFLIAKSKKYYSEKAMYLWMAMNGLYNFVANSGTNKRKENDAKCQRVMIRVCDLPSQVYISDDDLKKSVMNKLLSYLEGTNYSEKEIYELCVNKDQKFFKEIKDYVFTGMSVRLPDSWFSVFLIWLPYQIRCNYFHANKAMPIFMYKNEKLLKALKITNYFVETWLDQNLLDWIMKDGISEKTKKEIDSIWNEIG